jgi:Gpi18-like mannosyltransferase
LAQAACLAALLAFYWLARRIYSETGQDAAAHGYALRSTVLMAVFPTAFINYAIYAESLYLMFAILGVGLLFPRRPARAATASPLRYVWSGLALGLASAARPVGWLLDVIFGVEFLRRREWRWPYFLAAAVGALLSGVGMIAFIYYLYRLTGSLTAITQAQAEWGRSWQLPWVTVWLSLETAFSPLRVPGNWFLYAINWLDLLFTLFALLCAAAALIQSARRRFPWSLSLYLVASLGFLLSSMGPFVRGTEDLVAIPLWGMSRWVGQLFPQYLLLGSLLGDETGRRRWLTQALIGGSFLVELLFAAWWITGRWIG